MDNTITGDGSITVNTQTVQPPHRPKNKNLTAAYVLWACFGYIGIHRFYLGRIGTGILWFLTGGVFGIGWIVDAFILPRIRREVNAGF